jgi:hypothetical protein
VSPPAACEWWLFQVAIGRRLGHLAAFLPDQAKMMKRGKRGREPGFAYDCPDLTSALLTTLESEARRRPTPLRRGEDDPLANTPDRLRVTNGE